MLDVFPTPVGVFLYRIDEWSGLEGLPHARGGVSRVTASALVRVKSSPRPWGCFPRSIVVAQFDAVFPTPVGVFLCFFRAKLSASRLPHARGGVSLACHMAIHTKTVFPTPVGVFPKARTRRQC